MKDRRSNVVGSSLREIRLAKGLSQEDLALRSGVSATLISRYENARRNISLQNQQKLTDALEVDREQLLSGIIQPSTKRMPLRRNPKPIRLNDVVLDSIFLMLGNHSEPMEISLHYKPHPLQIPQKIRPVYESLAVKSKETALAKGFPYFNGPNTRLLRANEVHNRQAKTGEEIRGVVLELGPVSWEQFSVLNCYLDRRLVDGGSKTIREVFADEERLYANAPDLRWCQ